MPQLLPHCPQPRPSPHSSPFLLAPDPLASSSSAGGPGLTDVLGKPTPALVPLPLPTPALLQTCSPSPAIPSELPHRSSEQLQGPLCQAILLFSFYFMCALLSLYNHWTSKKKVKNGNGTLFRTLQLTLRRFLPSHLFQQPAALSVLLLTLASRLVPDTRPHLPCPAPQHN